MILLRKNISLQVLLAGAVAANQLPVSASYTDQSRQDGDRSDGLETTTNGATAVDIVTAPDGIGRRRVDNFTVQNADTAAANVTVRLHNTTGPVNTTLFKALLAVGDQIVYEDDQGFTVLDASGEVKSSYSVPTAKLAATENAYIRTDAGVKDLLVAAANDRIVQGTITVTTAFADGDGAQPTLTIGEESGSASKFAVAAELTGKAANSKIPFAGTLTGGKKLQGTLVAGTGTTSTGAYRIDVHAISN